MQTRHLFSALAIAALTLATSGAFAADGCRTIANGVQKCDVASTEAPAADVVQAKADVTGCRTIANGVQKCDVPSARSGDTAVAKLH